MGHARARDLLPARTLEVEDCKTPGTNQGASSKDRGTLGRAPI